MGERIWPENEPERDQWTDWWINAANDHKERQEKIEKGETMSFFMKYRSNVKR